MKNIANAILILHPVSCLLPSSKFAIAYLDKLALVSQNNESMMQSYKFLLSFVILFNHTEVKNINYYSVTKRKYATLGQ